MGQAYSSIFFGHGSSLLASLKDGDQQQLDKQLEREPILLIRSSYQGNNLVHLAAQEGHLHVLQLLVGLIKVHADRLAAEISRRCLAGGQNDQTNIRWKHLQLPGPRGSKSQVLRLLNPTLVLPTLLSWQNLKGITPLMMACRSGHADCVALLLSEGAHPLSLDKIARRSCLHYAAMAGHVACVDVLLNEYRMVQAPQVPPGQEVLVQAATLRDGATGMTTKFVDLRTTTGFTALHYASFWGHTGVLRALLRAGANALLPTANGGAGSTELLVDKHSTALHLAADNGHMLVAATLLMAHAEAMSHQGIRPLTASHLQQQPWEGQERTDPRAARNVYGYTPLAMAAASQRPRGLLLLLDPSLPIAWVLEAAGLSGRGFGVPKLAILAKAALDEHLFNCLNKLELEQQQSARQQKLQQLQEQQQRAEATLAAQRVADAAAAAAAATAVAAAAAASEDAGGVGFKCQMAKSSRSSSSIASSRNSCSEACLASCCAAACMACEPFEVELEPAAADVSCATCVNNSSGYISPDTAGAALEALGRGNRISSSSSSICLIDDDDDDDDDDDTCGICFDVDSTVMLAGCKHRLCFDCTRSIITATSTSQPATCPFCRLGVAGFMATE